MPPALTRSARRGEQRPDEAVELVLGAVVGVQRDVDGVLLGDLVGVRRERERAGHHVLDGRAGEVLGAAGGDLDDAVAAGLGEALDRGVEGLRRRDVDRRVGEGAGLGAVQHLGVHLGGGDGHGSLLRLACVRLGGVLASSPIFARPARGADTRVSARPGRRDRPERAQSRASRSAARMLSRVRSASLPHALDREGVCRVAHLRRRRRRASSSARTAGSRWLCGERPRPGPPARPGLRAARAPRRRPRRGPAGRWAWATGPQQLVVVRDDRGPTGSPRRSARWRARRRSRACTAYPAAWTVTGPVRAGDREQRAPPRRSRRGATGARSWSGSSTMPAARRRRGRRAASAAAASGPAGRPAPARPGAGRARPGPAGSPRRRGRCAAASGPRPGAYPAVKAR